MCMGWLLFYSHFQNKIFVAIKVNKVNNPILKSNFALQFVS
jgi:hypothetical protein